MLTQPPVQDERPLRRAIKVVSWAAAALGVLMLVGLLLLRFWIWPGLASWQPQAIASLEPTLAQHGLTLKIGAVRADWENWFTPRISLNDVSVQQSDGQLVLSVQEAQATLGLKSAAMLWRWQPVFHNIRLTAPFIHAERKTNGEWVVAGVPLLQAPKDGSLLDSVLLQGHIQFDRGELLWRDEHQNKTARFDDITFALNNLGPQHSWSFRATPPTLMGDRFSLQGSFRHGLLGDRSNFADWAGRASLEFSRVNAGELFEFVHLSPRVPLAVRSGQGGFRAQMEFSKGNLDDLMVDLDLESANLSWGTTARTPLTLRRLQGRIQAQLSPLRQTLRVNNLKIDSAQLSDQVMVGSAFVDSKQLAGSDITTTEAGASTIDLVSAMWLMEHLPLPANWKKELTQLQPRGRLNNLRLTWQAQGESTTGASLQTDFSELALAPGVSRPGFTALSGRVNAKEDGGELVLDSKSAVLVFPGVFLESAVQLDTLTSHISWTSKHLFGTERGVSAAASASTTTNALAGGSTPASALPVELAFTVKRLEASNADVSLEVAGKYDWSNQDSGYADLRVKILRANPARIARYVPLVVGVDTRDWLRDALLPSAAYSGTAELVGRLDDFPFRNPAQGRFLVNAKADKGSLRPAPGWPVINNINAAVEFDRQRFRLVAKGAKINDLTLGEVRAEIDDLEADRPLLSVKGAITGDLQRLIDTTNQSPLKADLGGATSDMKGRGSAKLDLSMMLDLDDTARSRVDGKLILNRVTAQLDPGLPEAQGVAAEIVFNQDTILMIKAEGQMLGGPLRVTTGKATPELLPLLVEGTATGSALSSWLEQSLGLSQKGTLIGSTRYSTAIELRGGLIQAKVESSLVGLASELPAPFKKTSAEDWGLRVDFSQGEKGARGVPAPQHWVISTNQQKLNARIVRPPSRGRETNVEIDSPAVAGAFTWTPASQSPRAQRAGRTSPPILNVRLSRLWLDDHDEGDNGSAAAQRADILAQDWPIVDAVIDDFRIGAHNWGRLEVQASPAAATRSWEISKFSLSNPDAVLTGKGQWVMLTGTTRGISRSRTSLEVDLQLKDGGALLARSGYPGLVKATQGKITGTLNWPGSPTQFSGATLSGDLSLTLTQGQFLKTEPGIGRLVGVLNLQSFSRRIKLDFRDVFSEGFTYERVGGDLQFLNGQASTRNLRIIGVQASVLLEGTADLRRETQDLRVLVLPEVNAGLASLGYAALINPAIGLGTFLAQYILRNPVREFLSYEYRITGGWADPVVEPVRREMKSEGPEMKAPE
jgi:uncharacterized protein YhdP